MNRKKRLFAACAAVFFVLCFSVVGMGNQRMPVATVSIGSFGINFQPNVSYAKAILAVSCPNGHVFYKSFASGVTPYLGLSDGDVSFTDGSYAYELRLLPHVEKGDLKNRKSAIPMKKAMIESGHFTIQGGSILTPGAQEGPARPLDVLHYDDVIITGSLCVGFDCANGESFGYDTIKLKENNLRLYFEDTSAGSFPSGDWRIRINDTTSGGASYFAIEDGTNGRTPFRIETGAPTHALYVEDYGRVGLGTSIPYVELHIVDGDSPTIRLDQDGSSGWTAQRWDLCGNETNFFIRDVTNGSKLCFRIQPNTPSSTLNLKSTGFVGIGTWSPEFKVHAQTTGENCAFVAERTSGARIYMNATDSFANFGSVTNHNLRLVANNGVKMVIEPSGDVGIGVSNPTHKLDIVGGAYCDGGAWVAGSSREYKENITDLTLNEAMNALENLAPVKFNYKINKEEEYMGFIAEDVPELVATNERNGVAPMDVIAVLTKVVQQQQKAITKLEKKIEELDNR